MSYDIEIRSKDNELVAILDTYESLVWHDERLEAGDFELYTYYDKDLWNLIGIDSMINIPDSNRTMLVETRQIKDSFTDAPRMIFSGHSLEYILHRRLISQKLEYNNWYIGDCIHNLLNRNILDNYQLDLPIPVNPAKYRAILNLKMAQSSWRDRFARQMVDGSWQNLQFSTSFNAGENLYDEFVKVLQEWGAPTLKFDIRHTDAHEFIIDLSFGTDRSWQQSDHEWVTFSSEMSNLKSVEYKLDYTEHATSFMAKAEHPDLPNGGYQIIGQDMGTGSGRDVYSGLDRREIWIDVSSIESTNENGNKIDVNQYINKVNNYIMSSGTKHRYVESLTGGVDHRIQYEYGVDYKIGDVVNVIDDFGHSAYCVVSGCDISIDRNGKNITPTFEFGAMIT